ncbi:anaphase-promoting complex subunit cdc26-like [Leptopilina heterotoma]|uniref:anaphase-promoting complex subunit cdc26-like n=1 Tax=Leptopilina heterotoma TaxID=63436 RepID=UPI001CA8456E|nr:anaphase-promoting complex subunit cdc26-like [Leptopilina heterotoma]
MIRRSPTRIEFRVEDLAEYDQLKKERDGKKENDRPMFNPSSWGGKISQNELHERIGFVSQSVPAIVERHNI